jgi:hypothetical protein
MNPVGPQTPGVYWVRRAIVLLVILVLLVGLIWWLGGRGGGDGTATAAPTTSAEPTGSTCERPGETGDGISPPDGWPGAAKDGGGDDGKAGCPGAIIGGCAG